MTILGSADDDITDQRISSRQAEAAHIVGGQPVMARTQKSSWAVQRGVQAWTRVKHTLREVDQKDENIQK